MNSNEKWQGKPAGRDGKPSEKRDVKSILKGTRGAAKSTTENENRNFNRTDYNQEQSGNSFSGEKRKFELKNGNSFNNDRRPYENRESRPQYGERKPYQNREGRPQYGERKPYENREGRPQYGERKPYENREGRPQYGERKPYENREGRPQYGERKPYQNRSEEGNRPRFKPRTNTDGGNYGNSDHKLTIKKPGEGQLTEFVEYRFDNQNDNGGARKTMRKRSGNYDPNAKYSTKKQLEYRKQVVDLTKPVRLNKFLANAGICSRREADEFIQAGVISVNGEIVTELGTKVMHADKILFHNQPVRSERKVYLLLNKPKDCVTTAEDTHARTTVLDLVKNACSERIYPVGRLDRNTTGVILLTNDGDLASKLTHPKYDKKKIYHVALDKPLVAEHYEAILGGVVLEDGKIAADSLEFVKDGDFKQVGIEIHSGQNRVVRRIFEKLGYRVVRLDRVYFAGLTKKSLPRGKYRFLNEREVNMLKMGAYE